MSCFAGVPNGTDTLLKIVDAAASPTNKRKTEWPYEARNQAAALTLTSHNWSQAACTASSRISTYVMSQRIP